MASVSAFWRGLLGGGDRQRVATGILAAFAALATVGSALQIVSLQIYGPTHRFSGLYVGAMATTFVATLAAFVLARCDRVRLGMHLFGGVTLAAVACMAILDATLQRGQFPGMLWLLPAGPLALGFTLGARAMAPYAATCVLLAGAMGLVHGDAEAGMSLASTTTICSAIAAIVAAAIRRYEEERAGLMGELAELKTELGDFFAAKHETNHRRRDAARAAADMARGLGGGQGADQGDAGAHGVSCEAA